MVYTSEYPIFYVTVDMVVLTLVDDELCALAIKRGEAPYAGEWALPGGFVEEDEDVQDAAERELMEETGVSTGDVVLEQLRTFGRPDRDPRFRVVSVAWLAVVPEAVTPKAGSDAAEAAWRPVTELQAEGLAFDHAEILGEAVERARSKMEYTTLATAFVRDEFTLAELRSVYEVMWGRELDPGNFQRKVRVTEDFVTPTGRTRPAASGRGRPAELFRVMRAEGQDRRELMPLSTPITRSALR